MQPRLSCYLLTYNSERRLREVLSAVRPIVDEIVVVDSGSSDQTRDIALSFGATVLQRPFDNFRDQRVYAQQNCSYAWILQLDSDEVVSEELAQEIARLKQSDFKTSDAGAAPDGFSFLREWYVLGKRVHAFYPVKTPDRVVRLYKKDRVTYAGSKLIHETNHGGRGIVKLKGVLRHYTCDSVDELYSKINLYTRLSAEDMRREGQVPTPIKVHVYPWLLWFRWYVLKGSWRDGDIGRLHAHYVRDTVALKYLKPKYDKSSESRPFTNSGHVREGTRHIS
jgi:glycosyltransferase involved in cell wall biosynthesis